MADASENEVQNGPTEGQTTVLKDDEVYHMKKTELKHELQKRNLRTTGNKSEFIIRLINVLQVERDRIESGKDEDDENGTDDDDDEGNDGVSDDEDSDDEIEVDELTTKELRFRLRRLGLKPIGSKSNMKTTLRHVLEGDKTAKRRFPNVDDDGVARSRQPSTCFLQADNDGSGSTGARRRAATTQRRQQPVEARVFQTGLETTMTFKDVEGVLLPFSGDNETSVTKWIKEFEDVSEACGWGEVHKIIYIRRLLQGSAKLFVDFYNYKRSWDNLKNALIKEFNPKIDSHTVHYKLQKRKKKVDETFQEYCYSMLQIASQINMETSAVIQYIIDGIEGDETSKTILYGAETISELREKLVIFEKIKSKTRVEYKDEYKTKKFSVPKYKDKVNIKCFNCGVDGHRSNDCPLKNQGPKFFRCNKYGHKSINCSVKPNEINKNNCNVVKTSNKKCRKTVLINDNNVKALIDTGSDISMLRADCYIKIGAPSIVHDLTRFKGIGSVTQATLGVTDIMMRIDDQLYQTKVHVVSENVMEYELLLGNDFLHRVEMHCKAGIIKIFKSIDDQEFEVLSIDCVVEPNEVDLSHVKDIDVRSEVENFIAEYKPEKTREVGVELKIILKDDIPVFSRPRRLALHEREEVGKIVKGWIEEGIAQPSNSEYTSPIVLVKKKNGETRVCIDYRILNKKVVKDRFPLPLIEDQIDLLQDSIIFSALDLKRVFRSPCRN